jgi:hypothetical protein
MIWLTVGGWLPALLIAGWLVLLVRRRQLLKSYVLIGFAACSLVLSGGFFAGLLVSRPRSVDPGSGNIVANALGGADMSIMMWSVTSGIAGLCTVVVLLYLNGIVALVLSWHRETSRTAAQRQAVPRSTSLLWATVGAGAAAAAVFALVGYVWIGQVRESNTCEHAAGRFVASEDAGAVRYLIDGDLPAQLTFKGAWGSGGSCPPAGVAQPSHVAKPLTWSADYGYPDGYRPPGPYLWGTVFPNPDVIQMHLTVSNYAYPGQTPRSTQAPGGEVLTINGQVAYLVHQSSGRGTQRPAVDILRWKIAPDIQAQLTGQADGIDGGIVALARRVKPVKAKEPRLSRWPYIVPFCLQTTPPVIQGANILLPAWCLPGSTV